MIGLVRREAFYGPSPYAMEPVVVADLTIGAEAAAGAPRIIDALSAMSTRWLDADEASGRPGDERLAAFLLRWSQATLTCVKGHLPASGYRRTGPGAFRLWIGFHRPAISFAALDLAARLAAAIGEDRLGHDHFIPELKQLWQTCRAHHPDSSDHIAMCAAAADGIPWMAAWDIPYHWQFGWGANSRVICSAASEADGYVGGRVIARKDLSKSLIARLGLPTPAHALLRDEEDIPAAIAKVGFPCVVKPVDGNGGRGVSAGLADGEQVAAAFGYARQFSQRPIMVEAFAEGTDHRIMVVEGRFAATIRREAPVMVGDGNRTLAELVEEQNRGRSMPGVFALDRLPPIVLDDAVFRYLAAQGLAPESIPAAGQRVRLRGNDNLSTGGSATDVSERTHPDIRAMAEAIAGTLGANLAGLDYVTTDIARSWRDVPGMLIELNLTPGMAVLTLAGRSPIEVGRMVLGGDVGRIPLDIAIVPDAALAEAEARAAAIGCAPRHGWASPGQARIGSLPLQVKRDHPWAGAMTLLSHKLAERALLLVPSRHLQRFGFPVDRADRIWLCATDLPEPWRDVAGRISASPPGIGTWQEMLRGNSFRAVLDPRQKADGEAT